MQSISLFRRVGALVALLVLLASCAQPTPSEAPPEPAAAPNAPTSAGGTLIMVFGSRDPSTIDPALVGDVQSAFIVRQLFSGLVRLDENMDVQPDLAERWELSDDGRTYTFVLRESLTFADGSPLTSADVIYSLERASDPSLSPFLPAQTYLGDIVGVPEKLRGEVATISGLQAPDERTVAITIDAPKSYFLAKLAHPTSFVVDQQQVEGDPRGWLDAPNAAGPFVIERWENDALMDLRRNDQFHRELARLDRVRLLIGANANNPLILYEQGDIDVTSVPAFALARVRDQSNPLSTQLVQVPQLSLFYLGMNVEIPPFDDPKIREAFSLLIDRERLAILTLADSASAARGILPPGMPGYNEELPLPQANIEAARQLISESSYGSVENLPPITAYGGGWASTLRDVARDELGISIEVRDFESFGDFLDALSANDLPLYSAGWIADYPDPENFLDLLFRGGSGENHTAYANPEVDALLDQAAVETDEARRWELYRQVEAQIIADAPVIPLYHDVEYTLIKPYVRGLTVTPLGILDLSTVELVR